VYENVLNCAFYTVLVLIILAVLGLDMLTFGPSVALVAVAIAFAMGSACTAILEGILMILVQRPYGKDPSSSNVSIRHQLTHALLLFICGASQTSVIVSHCQTLMTMPILRVRLAGSLKVSVNSRESVNP
jgi:hypothetical protein